VLGFQLFSDCTFLVRNTRVLERPVAVVQAGGEEGGPPPPRLDIIFASVCIIPSKLGFIFVFQCDRE
jgi:hypothetical protein